MSRGRLINDIGARDHDALIVCYLYKNPKRGSYVEMSEEGGKEFQEVLEQLFSGKKVTSAPKVFTTGEKKTIVDGAHVENTDFPNLISIANIEVVLIDSRMYIWDQKNSYIEIDSSSVLFDEIMADYNG